MRLPFDVEGDLADLDVAVGVDADRVDWERVRRSSYVIQLRINYRYEGPVRRLHQRLVVQPPARHGDQRRVSREVRVIDATPHRVRSGRDDFGNHVVDIHIPYVAEGVTFVSWSVVERSAGPPHLIAASALHDARLLTHTPLTEPDEALLEVARELEASGSTGEELAEAVCRRVHQLMHYEHDVTGIRTSAAEAFAQRSGVCQDFAHVMLAITRALGLPSRYVSGQLLGVGGSHAWVEVIVPGDGDHARVVPFDPTHGRRPGMSYVTIAVGRDYAHVAPMSGTYVAPHAGVLTVAKRVAVLRVDADRVTNVDWRSGHQESLAS